MRLIDADVLKEKLYIESDNFNPVVTEKEIDETPTVEAIPVVHGEWIYEHYTWNCSICGCHPYKGYIPKVPNYNFCPNCGVKMKVVE